MGTYTGTTAADVITPGEVSGGVSRLPAGSFPSDLADTIVGLAGNDTLDGGGGADSIRGGDGNDQIRDMAHLDDAPNAGNVIHGDAGNDVIRIEGRDAGGRNPFGNTAYGESGNDVIDFSFYGDLDGLIEGEPPTGTILGSGGPGDDELGVSSVALQPSGLDVTLEGGAGADVLWATAWVVEHDGSSRGGDNPDRLVGGTGDDVHYVYEQVDLVVERPEEGYDTVVARNTDYTLSPNVEKLEMAFAIYGMDPENRHGIGNDLDNLILGYPQTEGVQRLDGVGGNDAIYGGTFADAIDGGDGDDTLYGRPKGWEGYDADTDTLRGGNGNDTICGGSGLDDPTDAADRIYGDGGNDQVWAGGGNDIVYGGTGNEIHLSGQSGNDTLYGDAGTDYLAGGSGNDILYGGIENDVLYGGIGLDRLSGQGGTDTFDYDAVSHSGAASTVRDVITDFTGVGGSTRTEVIDLSTIDANTGVSGNQAFTFRGTGAFSAPGQVRVTASGTDTLIQANVAGTSGAEMEILVTDGSALPGDWKALDFLL